MSALARRGAVALAALAALALVACGGDDAPSKPPTKPTAAGAKPAARPGVGAGSGSAAPLTRMVEHQISDAECPVPAADAKPCDPAATRTIVFGKDGAKRDPNDKTCPDRQYCLPTQKGYLCGACPERETIRHQFKDRDFVVDGNRDPFQSFLLRTQGAGSGSGDAPTDPGSRCTRADQLRATDYSYMDLKLVGIVAQGTQRKVLMMAGNVGQIVKRGDCVGKEKAWVKTIDENNICFEITDPGSGRVVEPPCIELHSKNVTVTPLPNDPTGQPTTAPVITPDTVPAPAPAPPVTRP